MFLAINQINGRAAKKRKKEEQRQDTPAECGNVILPPGGIRTQTETDAIAVPQATATTASAATIAASALAASSKVNLIENMLLEYPYAGATYIGHPRDCGSITAASSPTTMADTPAPNGAAVAEKCKNCHHALSSGSAPRGRRSGQQTSLQQMLPPCASAQSMAHVACPCECDCVNKSLFSSGATTTSSGPNPLAPTATPALRSTPMSMSTAASASTPAPITSLHAVYTSCCTLALALATLAVLFYSHVQTTSHTPSATTKTTTDSNSAFREQFRRELFASEDVLRSIVAQILQQEATLPQQHQHQDQYKQQQPFASSTDSASQADLEPSDQYPQRTKRSETATTWTSTASLAPQGGATPGTVVKNERKYVASARYAAEEEAAATATAAIGHAGRMRRDISSSPASMHADPFIEFFNPNHRKVLEEQDVEIRKRTGMKGAAPGGDEWIYLNTYCRVPEKIITGFCKGTQDYCPPAPQGPPGPLGPKGTTGPPGLPGIPGPKGNRGDVGLPGPSGVDGSPGPMGPRGPKGDIGIPGRAGLDGRDGVPGEPGLDGVPGRAGADGIPGKDGLPGLDGRDGLNGKDGKDGLPGPKGAQGPPGERGLKGIAGPRGRPGKSGSNGTPGIPGINAWKVQLPNGSFSSDLLIPPSIADVNAPHIRRNIIVEEGKSLNLSCAASGNPMPHIEWRRDDGRTINIHGVEMSSVSGPYLKFNNITRNQMAAYTCFADNGIVPVANATFLVEVHLYRQMIYAEYGHSATLECMVEAFPEAIRYWERAYDGKILDPGDKYRIETYPDGFKTTMRLTITNLRKDDFGYYHCVARNEINATMVNFEVAPQDPNSETPYVGKEIKVYGQRPPEAECPLCEQCPDPSLYQCKDSINSNFEIQPTGNYSYPGLPKRQKSCLLYAVGKPVFHKAVNEIYGCWLKDPAAKEIDREKTFVTNENDSYNLFEFSTKIQYRMNSVPRRKYEIREGFHGNAHVVYNGSFYYNQRNTDLVVKLDLTTQKKITTQLPYAGIAAGNRLYSTDYNYMDFNVDEVGLWVIYSTYDSNNTLVAKLDAETLKMQYNFNITLDHRKFGEMFIVCGHLYAIESCTEKNSQIRYVVDLYNGKLLNVDLPFSNPFRKTTTVGYNPLTVDYYYIARMGEKNPSGKLFSKYRNKRSKKAKLTSASLSTSSVDASSSLLEKVTEIGSIQNSEVDESVAAAYKLSLNRDCANWEEVCQKWKLTHSMRQKDVKTMESLEFLRNWSKLNHSRAPELELYSWDKGNALTYPIRYNEQSLNADHA